MATFPWVTREHARQPGEKPCRTIRRLLRIVVELQPQVRTHDGVFFSATSAG